MPRSGRKAVGCPVETTLKVIGGRWKVLVLHYLLPGTVRFGALHRKLDGISHRTLTKQLRQLEADGMLRRRVYREVPPKVEYSLTPLGRSLEPVLLSMHAWGERFSPDALTPAAPGQHRTKNAGAGLAYRLLDVREAGRAAQRGARDAPRVRA